MTTHAQFAAIDIPLGDGLTQSHLPMAHLAQIKTETPNAFCLFFVVTDPALIRLCLCELEVRLVNGKGFLLYIKQALQIVGMTLYAVLLHQ